MYYHFEGDVPVIEPDGKNHIQKHLVVDTKDDIPEPEENWSTGSYVFIIDTQDIKFLNSSGEWK